MKLKGTTLQIKVWKYLKTIPKGQTRTYKQVAISIKKPKAIILVHPYGMPARIDELISLGIPVHYFEGNHDFHLEKLLQDHGVEVHKKPVVKKYFGKSRFSL